MDEFQQKQLKMMKRQQICMVITATCALLTFLVIAGVAFTLVPRFNNLYDTLLVTSRNLEVVSNELVNADIGGTIQGLDDLIATTGEDVSGAMDKLNSIDFNTLNESIQSLHDVVTPMADFFGRFR